MRPTSRRASRPAAGATRSDGGTDARSLGRARLPRSRFVLARVVAHVDTGARIAIEKPFSVSLDSLPGEVRVAENCKVRCLNKRKHVGDSFGSEGGGAGRGRAGVGGLR